MGRLHGMVTGACTGRFDQAMTCHDLASVPACTLSPEQQPGATSHSRASRPYGRFWEHEGEQLFGPLDTTPPFARYWSATTLGQWGIPADDPVLVVGELAANAVQAVQRAELLEPIRVRLLAGPGRLVIEIWDQAPGRPAPRDIAKADESGRGLFIVAAFCAHWGWYAHNDWKIVYADMTL